MARRAPADTVRLLAPFDPVVWDRTPLRAVLGLGLPLRGLHAGAETPAGYYALPLLWRDRVIGWGNLSVKNGKLESDFGYVKSPPRDRAFKQQLDAELDRMRAFLRLKS